MNNHPPQRRVGNIGSILLTPQENECLFNYLGRKCITLCTAVVQVYGADRSSSWVKRCCGVACLIKDNPLRSYFIRVFDIKEGKTMFEQELYNNFSINSSRSYFISFSGDNCQVGLNFASEEEAKRFRATLKDLLGRRQRKTGNYGGPAGSVYTPSAFSSPQPLTFWTGSEESSNLSHCSTTNKPTGPNPKSSHHFALDASCNSSRGSFGVSKGLGMGLELSLASIFLLVAVGKSVVCLSSQNSRGSPC